MNGVIDIDAFEKRQARFVRGMMLLSLLFHGGIILVGPTVSSLFPSSVPLPVVTVELTEAPMSTLPEEEPAPPVAPVETPKAESAVSRDAPVPTKTAPRPSSAQRWLEKLDAGLARMPEAPVARKIARAGGIPVRHWENGASPRPGDFPPAVAPEKNPLLGKHLAELEDRVRRSGHPSVGLGNESEASVMFGGTGTSAGEPIPAWIRDMIRKKVRGYLPELEAAYSAALRRNPELKGKFLVRFRIDPSGKVLHADPVDVTLGDHSFVTAIVETMKRWTFEPTAGLTVEVLYPFVFVASS